MSSEYTQAGTKIEKVPVARYSESAMDYLREAIQIREEREETFEDVLKDDNEREEYLESISKEIKLRFGAFRGQIFEIGRLLVEAKKKHFGSFGEWIKQNCPFSLRTAGNFMSVYKACMGRPELVEFFPVSSLYVVCSESYPDDIRKLLFDHASGPYDLNQNELLRVAVKYRNGEIGIDSQEVQRLLRRKKNDDRLHRVKCELEALEAQLNTRKNLFKAAIERMTPHPLVDGSSEEEEGEEEFIQKLGVMYERFIKEVQIRIARIERGETQILRIANSCADADGAESPDEESAA